MPYEWSKTADETTLELWPYRSLPKIGFVIVISIAAGLIALPALALVGTIILWVMLPFLVISVAALWFGLQKSYRDGEILEQLRISESDVHLSRHQPKTPSSEWNCNPYWVKVNLHENTGPVRYYVTLEGNGREVEIGAFLSEDERQKLYRELLDELRR
jgi:uncharacterized membrane protein